MESYDKIMLIFQDVWHYDFILAKSKLNYYDNRIAPLMKRVSQNKNTINNFET